MHLPTYHPTLPTIRETPPIRPQHPDIPPEMPPYAYTAKSLLQTVTIDTATINKYAILDSGATSNFLVTNAPATDIKQVQQGLRVKLPNGDTVKSSHKCNLLLPLPQACKQGHIIPGLEGFSLISVVTLCNAGCEVLFTAISCTITHKGKVILRGRKCTKTGLWLLPLDQTTPTNEVAANVNSQDAEYAANIITTMPKAELAKYLHQSFCSPPKVTFLKAIDNKHLSSIPGLTHDLIHKYLPPSTATDKGHMRRVKQGIQSTRSTTKAKQDARLEVADMNPTQHVCATHDMFCFAALADANTGTMYTDLPGPFPVRSFTSMQYIFVAYVYDINTILARPMQNRSAESMQKAFQDIITHLDNKGCKPRLNVMDNECSKIVEQYVTSQNIDIQLVPPANHRVNAAERAIATFKEHFIAALATIDINCPLQLWDQFLAQVQDSLNMLRTSRRNPTISAYEDLEGPFDYNKTPFVPLGTKALVYDDPDSRAAWAPHATDAFTIGLHFWCPLT